MELNWYARGKELQRESLETDLSDVKIPAAWIRPETPIDVEIKSIAVIFCFGMFLACLSKLGL